MIKLKAVTYTGKPRADVEYEIRIVNSIVFVILYDLDTPGSRSITNDAEAVIEDLKKVIKGIGNAIIIYRDSEGIFDRIIYAEDEKKVRFIIYGEFNIEEVIDRICNY